MQNIHEDSDARINAVGDDGRMQVLGEDTANESWNWDHSFVVLIFAFNIFFALVYIQNWKFWGLFLDVIWILLSHILLKNIFGPSLWIEFVFYNSNDCKHNPQMLKMSYDQTISQWLPKIIMRT